MMEMFKLGGFGMWLTLAFGLLSVAISVRYAIRPERRFVPLMLSSGLLTLISGGLGFATGVTVSLLYLDHVPADRHWISLIGLGESMMNVNLALALLAFAAMASTVGAWRSAHAAAPDLA